MENASLKRCTEEFGFWLDASALLRDLSVMLFNARRTGTSICPRHTATRSLLSDREEYARQLLKWTSWEAMIAGNCMSLSKCSVFVRDQRTGAKGKNAICNCQPFTLPFWSKRERGKNGAIVQMKEKKNNSQPSSFFYQLPSLLRQRKHLVPSVPPEKRGKKERSETLHPKCQWGQRGCQLPRTTRCWKTASLNEGCAFRKPS